MISPGIPELCTQKGLEYDSLDGSCVITDAYCNQYGHTYDPETKDCIITTGQKVLEVLFTPSLIRSMEYGFDVKCDQPGEEKSIEKMGVCDKNCQCKNNKCGHISAESQNKAVCCQDGIPPFVVGEWVKYYNRTLLKNQNAIISYVISNAPDKNKYNITIIDRDAEPKDYNDIEESALAGVETKFTNYLGSDYCTPFRPDSICLLNNQCPHRSDNNPTRCYGNGTGSLQEVEDKLSLIGLGTKSAQNFIDKTGFIKGNCDLLEDGQTCTSDGSCRNDSCGINGNSVSVGKTCCGGPHKTSLIQGHDYCQKVIDDGGKCNFDTQCKNGDNSCYGNVWGTREGVCGLQKAGALCRLDSQCESGSCGRWNDDNQTCTQCCDKGVVTIGTKDFCTEVIEDGLVCHFDVQCKSGNCEGNNYGMNEGKCSAKKKKNKKV
jgi:hypothetical protein